MNDTKQRSSMYLVYMLLFFLAGGAVGYLVKTNTVPQANGNFYANEHFIQSLFERNTVDLSDYKDVFAFAFHKLADEVMVFPTENYYYFNFNVEGKIMRSVFHLPPESEKDKSISFGYHQTLDRLKLRNLYERGVAGGGPMGKEQGAIVNKVSDFAYDVSYQNKTVRFRFNDIKVAPPIKAKLMEDEIYVGPCFDESGLAFHLIFNDMMGKLYWILNEDIYVTEHFIPFKQSILIGNRTSFAFYNDSIRQRKVLIGANGREVLNNTWYDGPFDQMPDNYVGTKQIEVKKYLETQYSQYKDKIDEYGQFLFEKDSRIPVANYRVYYEMEELLVIDSCRVDSETDDEFFACITEQVYEVPDNFE